MTPLGRLQKFFRWQVEVSRRLDARFFGGMSVDGNQDFVRIVREAIPQGAMIADIGGGKTPFFEPGEVSSLDLSVVGVDISGEELHAAPAGSYDNLMVGPIEKVRGAGDCDFAVAQSVLEHVYNGREAAQGIASFVKQGGWVLTFCPSRRAWFARLNLLLPEKFKRSVLFYVFPQKRERQGFPAHYDGCTPEEMTANMASAGIGRVEVKPYFVSSYFMFFVPLFIVWRVLTFPLMKLWPERYCETFVFIGRKE